MARLLHRLGLGAARRPIAVLLLWVLVIAGVGAGAAAWQRPLTNEFDLPDSEFGQVLEELGDEVPAVAGGTGTVVVHSPDGFTPAQHAAFDEVRRAWQQLPHVTGVVDPFAAQARLDRADERLAQAERQLRAGQARADRGERRLAGLQQLVEQGRRDIARIRRTDPDDATLPAREAGQADLEHRLADGRRQLAAAERRLDAGWRKFRDGEVVRQSGRDIRLVGQDGRTALVQVRFDEAVQEISPDDLDRVAETGAVLEESGLQVDYGQELSASREAGGVGEAIGVGVAAVVLVVVLGSLVIAGLPLLVAFVGVGVSMLGGLALTHWIDLQQMAPVLGMMLGLAVGIDYALFIVNRHRNQLAAAAAHGPVTRDQVRSSIGLATGTAGSAVVVAGTTVVIALAALAVSGIPALLQMGALAAATVVVTVLVAVTLTPALLSLSGTRAVPRRLRRSGGAAAPRTQERGWSVAWVALVTRRAPAAVAVVALVMGVLAIPALSLRLGLPDGGSESRDTTAFRAYERVADTFGAGANGPVLVKADLPQPVSGAALVDAQADVAKAIASVDDRAQVMPVGTSADGRTLAFQVVPAEGPAAESTVALVEGLRTLDADSATGREGWLDGIIADADPTYLDPGVEIGVTGQTVANIEVSSQLAKALPLYVVLVVGLSLVLLTMVFRSVLVPVIATAGFLLSVGASFGAVVAVYQWGWLGAVFDVHHPSAVFSFMPTLLIGILFGLAMDYQMFLVSGMRESYVHGEDARRAVRSGFASGARVVAAAALIMVSVFAGFVWSEMAMARPIGFGLAVGVALDAFLVRMTLTPALMSLLGDRAWWIPVWLDRLLPNLDVEGSALVEARRPARRTGAREDALV